MSKSTKPRSRKSGGDKVDPRDVTLETASVGELQFELLRRALNRTLATIKDTEIALAHLRGRQERQMREMAIQFTRMVEGRGSKKERGTR